MSLTTAMTRPYGKASEQVNDALISKDSETSERRKKNSAPSLKCTVEGALMVQKIGKNPQV
jgi:hypothetical protein